MHKPLLAEIAVITCASSAVAQMPTTTPPETAQSQIDTELQKWKNLTPVRVAAMKCPVIEPWQIMMVKAAILRKQRRLADLGANVDFKARSAQAIAAFDAATCSDPGVRQLLDVAEQAYAVSFVGMLGWYPALTEPCHDNDVTPISVKIEQDRLVAKYSALSPLVANWAASTNEQRKKECENLA